MSQEDIYDKVVELARRRGFFWPSYEIYGGVAGFYDIGPYGFALKKKIIEAWRRFFIFQHQDYVVEIETPVMAPSIVFEASGHVESFTDPIVRCKKCGRIYRADHLVEEVLKINAEGMSPQELTAKIRENNVRCPVCGGELSDVTTFNLLFKTQIGPYEGSVGYLRPELAQGMFTSFKRTFESLRGRLPLGIAQVGRVARNEISPRQGMIRLRDFTIMELEFFFDPKSQECPNLEKVMDRRLRLRKYEDRVAGKGPMEVTVSEAISRGLVIHPCMAYWMVLGLEFLSYLGIPRDEPFFEEKGPHERAHYATQVFDLMVRTSRWGWVEVAGFAYRGDYDLSRHMKFSGQDLQVFEPYKEPIVVKSKKIIVDKSFLGRTFKERAPELMAALSSMDPEDVERQINSKGSVTVAGVEVPAVAVKVVETEEKISGRKFIPHVVEPSFGTDRILYVVLERSYREKEGRVVLSLPRHLAPVDAAVFPLVEGDERLSREALRLRDLLVSEGFTVIYDDVGSIGKRYARVDELGVPAAFTVDYRTLEDGTVTMRDRDTWEQVRLKLEEAPGALRKFIYNQADIKSLGVSV
ncbi:MAG: glycine--tRNA ligase [Acidilobus sp.]|nr:glycine--tRNA ligase [Acidilobus sp.]